MKNKKKKLLYLSQVYPYPPDGGGKIKTLNSVITLAKEYEVHAVFISEKEPSKSELNYLKKHGVSEVKVFYNEEILESVKDNYPKLIKNFLSLTPHYVFQYTHAPAKQYIQQKISNFKPDIIQIDHINIAQYLPPKKKEAWILEHHNLEFYLLWTRFLHSTTLKRKLYLLIETVLTYLFESRTIKAFDYVFTISEEEEKRTKYYFNITNCTAQPLIYSSYKFKKTTKENPNILFIGSIGWPPNEDAVEWFLNSMFPKIQKRIPNAQVHIVGKENPEVTKRLPRSKKIFLHGYQKDLTKFLQKADVFILPFRMGGGVRIKSLTALAARIPIVSTKLGVEGLSLQKGKEYLQTDTPDDFAKSVCKILTDKKLQKNMQQHQKKYLQKNHSTKENIKWLKKYRSVTQDYSSER